MFRDPLVKLVQSTLPLPVPFVDRLTALCGPYWRFLVTPENVDQVKFVLAEAAIATADVERDVADRCWGLSFACSGLLVPGTPPAVCGL